MPPLDRSTVNAATAILLIALTGRAPPANAQQLAPFAAPRPPFTATLSNNTPLAFGMGAEDASRVLGSPLNYISGRPGDEIFMAVRHVGGSGFFPRDDKLYL